MNEKPYLCCENNFSDMYIDYLPNLEKQVKELLKTVDVP